MIVRINIVYSIFLWLSYYFITTASSTDVICFSVEFEARMGNLMFEYGAVVGLCAKHNKTIEDCAQLIMPKFNDPDTPVPEFVQTFNIPTHKIEGCNIDKRYIEHAESKEAVMFDEALLNISSGTMIKGYLQSYKYFHPHGEAAIRNLYTFSPLIQNQSQSFIHSIRKQLPALNHTEHSHNEVNDATTTHQHHEQFSHHKLSDGINNSNTEHLHHSGYKLVGVHVRLGDKLNNPFYNGWSLSVHYYNKAIQLIQAQHNHTAFIFFTGGATNKNEMERDKEWTKQNLAGNITYAFHEDSNNHLVALHSLSLCDIIIAAHSSYSWWAAYLSGSAYVVAPRHMYPHRLPLFMFEDYYLPHWQLLSEDPSEDRIIGYNPFPAVIGGSSSSGGGVKGSTIDLRHTRRGLRGGERIKS